METIPETLSEEETVRRTPLSRGACFAAAVLPVCAMLQFPGIAFSAPVWNVRLFSTGAAVLLAAGLIFLFPRKFLAALKTLAPADLAAFGVLTLIGFIQVFRPHAGTYLIKDYGMLFLYVALPFFGLAFRRELLRILPFLMTVFWCMNFSCCMVQKFGYGQLFFGIPSNINWNSAFTIASGAFAVYWILTFFKKRIFKILCIAVVAGGTIWIAAECASRASLLALLCVSLLGGYFLIPEGKPRKLYRTGLLVLLLTALTALVFALKNPGFRNYIQHDDRTFFYYTVPDMICASPVFGSGLPSFEQEYLKFRTPAFFSLTNNAVRTNHPHNDLLFAAAGMGLLGLAAWLWIAFAPVAGFFRNSANKRFSSLEKLILFVFLMFLIHAQLDLIFFQLPTAVFALILPGILLGSVREEMKEQELPVFFRAASLFAGCILCAGTVFAVSATFLGAHLVWRGEGELMKSTPDFARAGEYFRQVASLPQQPEEILYKTVQNFLWMNDEHSADIAAAAERMDHTATPDYAHINIFRGRALINLGRLREAEPYLIRDAEIYSVTVVPLMTLAYLYQQTGEKEKFDFTQTCIREIMKKRDILPEDIPLIIQNPEYDMRPWTLPRKQNTSKP